ncbi:hypothetical protein GQ457_13G014970 [Hibiscus cannabinus]
MSRNRGNRFGRSERGIGSSWEGFDDVWGLKLGLIIQYKLENKWIVLDEFWMVFGVFAAQISAFLVLGIDTNSSLESVYRYSHNGTGTALVSVPFDTGIGTTPLSTDTGSLEQFLGVLGSMIYYVLVPELAAYQEEKLIATLRQHKEALGWTIADIKGISPTICMHKILLDDDHKPTVDAQRRLNQAMKDVVRKEILKWLDADIIYPISDSEWVSPVQCVLKKGGITVISNEKNNLIPTRTVTGLRVCMDYRKLNKATRKYHFPLPFIDQMLDRLAGKQFYCFLDGYSGYKQIAIAPEDQFKTTFTCPYGTFAFRRMSFGLCNAPATFQRCMTAIFSDLNEDCLEIFMDDFSTFGDNFDNCLNNLEKVLKRCKETNLVLNWEKCHFMVDEGIVPGHKISSKGMEVDKAKIEVISKLPPPTTVKGIRSFLGHAGFYRRFIEDFSKITKPLCSLLEQDRQFEFNNDCTKALNLLK